MIRRIVLFSMALLLAVPALARPDAAKLYSDNCAACHAPTRLGGTGPALIPESLGRIKGEKLEALIATLKPLIGEPVLSLDQLRLLRRGPSGKGI